MGRASRANRTEQQRLRQRLAVLATRVKLGALTGDDVRFLNTCGPNVRAYVWYRPQVALYQPKVTLA